MTTNFDPGVYAGLSPEIRLYALGLMPQEPIRSFEELALLLGRANVTPLEENPALDTEAATRAKVEKAPFSAQKVGREALKLWNSAPGGLSGALHPLSGPGAGDSRPIA